LTRLLDSREFKLIVKPQLFVDINTGIKKVQRLVDNEIKKLNGKFKPDDSDLKLKYRRTYFLDTSDFRLHSKNFFLRIREDNKPSKYNVTLKCRHPDRYISSAYNLSDSNTHELKFEEDIITPHVSKFSMSVNFDQDQEPNFNSIKDLKSKFRGLRSYDLGDGKLLKVNNFEAEEISVKLGKVAYDVKDEQDKGDNKINLFLNFWYSPKDKKLPVIVEFTYSYSALKRGKSSPNKGNKGKMLFEEFPYYIVKNTYEFYTSLQSTEIADLSASRTKTEFAYNYK
jgi:hypothetical protein